jgi:hypothetical protein
MGIGQLLHFLQTASLIVLGDGFVFERFFQKVV